MARQPFRRVPVSLALVWARSNVISLVLAIFIVVSLALQAATIIGLLRIRNTTARQLDVSANDIARLRQQSVTYNFPVDQTVSLDTTIAINRTIDIPINLTVPISETLSVPIETPLGAFNIDVPLNLEVPISETVSVTIDEDIPVSADVPIKTEIPVAIKLGDPPLGDIFRQFEEALRTLREGL